MAPRSGRRPSGAIRGVMRKFVLAMLTTATLALLPAAYVAYPFWTAWAIREAIKSGDSEFLARKVDFTRVRETLAPSLARMAFDLPDPADEAAEKPGLWKRFKAYWGQGAVNRMVDKYVTAEGLPQLFRWRKLYRETVSGETDEQALPRLERFARFWARLKRAEFKSPTVFEVEMADRYDASRHHIGLLELDGFEWKLIGLRVRTASADDALASAALP